MPRGQRTWSHCAAVLSRCATKSEVLPLPMSESVARMLASVPLSSALVASSKSRMRGALQDRARKRHALLLAAAQHQPTLAHDRVVACRHRHNLQGERKQFPLCVLEQNTQLDTLHMGLYHWQNIPAKQCPGKIPASINQQSGQPAALHTFLLFSNLARYALSQTKAGKKIT